MFHDGTGVKKENFNFAGDLLAGSPASSRFLFFMQRRSFMNGFGTSLRFGLVDDAHLEALVRSRS